MSKSLSTRSGCSSRGPFISMTPLCTRSITTAFYVTFLLLLLYSSCSHCSPASPSEVENEREFGYETGSPLGPERWGLIHEDWKDCNNGHLQSPIDLTDQRVEVVHTLGKLKRSYRPNNATMVNRGHDIMLKWTDCAGRLWCNGTEYFLKQLHWHSPSEHSINGERFALEMHMLHESTDKKLAVVGILYTHGHPDPFLTNMEKYIHAIKNVEHDEEKVGVVDPRLVKRGSRKYYRYIGSLTTPPCTEGVVWTIVKKVRTVSKEQVELLRDAVNDGAEKNARPVQSANKRGIQLYRPYIS